MTTYIYDVMEADEWGMRWDRPPVRTVNPSSWGYQHHSAGSMMDAITDANGNGVNADDAFRRINEMAIGEGMSAIDYTALVHEADPDARGNVRITIGIARGPWLPAATFRSNEVSKAVCALGYFHPGSQHSGSPSAGMLEGCARAWFELYRRGWVTRDALVNLRGHRQNPPSIAERPTACPGDFLFPHVPAIGRRALELAGAAPTPAPTPTPAPAGSVLLYRVVPGDSYYVIARKVYADGQATAERVQLLQEANADNATINPGELLNIPGRL